MEDEERRWQKSGWRVRDDVELKVEAIWQEATAERLLVLGYAPDTSVTPQLPNPDHRPP